VAHTKNTDLKNLSFNAKRRISAAGIKIDFLQVINYGPLWSRREIVLECFNASGRSFSERFNRSVRTVANIPDNLVPRRSTLREETITHALHFTLD
jgi:hypothetical protein